MSTDTQDGGALGWLDSLGNTVLGLSNTALAVKANLKAAKTSDKTAVAANSPVQFSVAGIPVLWIVGGLLVIGVGVFLLSRRG